MVIDKKMFRLAEERIRNYYRKNAKIKSLKEKISFLENSIKIIEAKMENNYFYIPSNLKSTEFGEKIQSSCGGSPIEQSMIKVLEGYENKIAAYIKEIGYLENLIFEIEEDYKIIECNMLNSLEEEERTFLEEAYKKRIPNWKLANKYHMSEVSCTRKKKRLIREIIIWEKDRLSEI
ncbi:TPA: hypothetical protein I9Z65_000150 [Clostridium perfringens]|uniref:hypothetical protein n=1 Tax=Clostridium perfringens TaxID=1502 RepID=UPI001B826063|nr:hypothetical protein [Clostridium perfringens]MDH2475942.1 hypothetical protein [Clostridium perfringens]HBC2028645.1 hypothetical protein [Clostridium perfringens]HBC2031976.1 hypothetical protein [Clostridium perfringens]HBC2055711.1 hypothetical protein [Clostridium perfringens]HBC2069327.1 hypothetical protein [Clostridium perfringens]